MTHTPDRDDLRTMLDDERGRERKPTRIGRVGVIVAAAGLAVAVGAGATLAATAATSIAEYDARMAGPTSDAIDPAGDAASTTPAPDDPGLADATPAPAEEAVAEAVPPTEPVPGVPGAVGTTAGGSPLFDASTDIAVIPRPAPGTDDDPENTEIWLAQQGIIGDCMLEAGFDYTFTPYWLRVYGDWGTGWAGYSDGYKVALDGPPDRPLGDDYDWRTAGCIGYAVHVTGMDDAH